MGRHRLWRWWWLVVGVFGVAFVGCVGSAAAAVTEFGSSGDGDGQFSQPSGVAVFQQSGVVYVSDRSNARVEKFGPQGEFVLAWGWGVADGAGEAQACTLGCGAGVSGSGGGQFQRPEGIAVDNDPLSASFGDVYVVDTGNNRIEKFDAEGHFLLAFGREVNKTAHEKGETANEDICPVNPGDKCQPGAEGTEPGAFANIEERAVAVDATGTVYVGDENRVQEFTGAGGFVGEVPLAGAGRTRALALDSSNDLYLISTGRLGVRKYDGTGINPELGEPRRSAEPRSLTIGPGDELLVDENPDSEHHTLLFSPSGSELAAFDAGPNGGSQGIAWGEEAKRVYAADEHHSRVRLLALPAAGPLVFSESAGEAGTGTVVLAGVVNPEGAATEYHFEYGTTPAYGQSTPLSAPLTPVDEVQSVTLAATGGTFTLAFEGQASAEIPFDATAAEVQAALEGIPGLGVGQVAVSGEPAGPWSVQFTGARAGENVPELTADAANLTGPEPSAGVSTITPGISLFDDRAVSAALTELQPGTTYHFRLVAADGSHTTFGEDQTFATLPAVSVVSESVSQVTAESARLATVLNAHGLASEYRFEYGATAAYGSSVPEPDASAGSSTADAAFEVLLEGLAPDTSYHYRVTATNTLGTVHGPDRVFTTRSVPTGLADGRGWEQVSPIDKHGVSLEAMAEEGSVIQAAEDGSGTAYIAKAPIDSEPQGSRSIANTQLLSSHGPAGWSTKDIATPHEHPAGLTVGHLSEYKLFSSDLSVGFVEPEGTTRLSPQAGERTPYAGHGDGCTPGVAWCYTPLATPVNVTSGAEYGGLEIQPEQFTGGVTFVSASEDGRTAVLSSPQDLTTPSFEATGHNSVYRWQNGVLSLISVLPGNVPAASEGLTSSLGNLGVQVRGAVSGDGNRFVFETKPGPFEHHLWVRDVARGETVQVDLPQPGARGGAPSPVFQVASNDGRRVFFTDTQRLLAGGSEASGEPDLYVCELGVVGGHLACALKDLTLDEHAGENASVVGAVIGIGGEGQFVYYVANGRLAAGAVPGDCLEEHNAGQEEEARVCNLYVEDVAVGRPQLVGVLSARDSNDWRAGGGNGGANLREVTARVSGSGQWLAFMSLRSLTGFDNRDARSGVADQEVYLFDRQTGSLRCVSCAGSGARPAGVFDAGEFPGLLVDRTQIWAHEWLAGSLPGWTNTELGDALYQSRYLSDSGRLFFNSAVGLVPGDGNGKMDVYEFEPDGVPGCAIVSGCVSLVSAGSSAEESALLDASGSGDDVFFLTAAKLVPGDSDSAFDVYDAHVCSVGWACPAGTVVVAPSCGTADSCRAAPAPQPAIFGAPASATFSGPGNAPASSRGAPPVKLTRAQLLARALKACAHKQRRKRASCRRAAKRRYAPAKKHTTARKAAAAGRRS